MHHHGEHVGSGACVDAEEAFLHLQASECDNCVGAAGHHYGQFWMDDWIWATCLQRIANGKCDPRSIDPHEIHLDHGKFESTVWYREPPIKTPNA